MQKNIKMKIQNLEKRLTLCITAIWSTISLIGGINFIKKYYDVGLSNYWCPQVSKSEQIIWAIIAFGFAAFLIYSFSSFIIKAIMYNENERKIIFFRCPF